MNLWIITVNFGETLSTKKLIESLSIIKEANSIKIVIADNATTSSELKSENLISTDDLINAVDSSLSLLPAGASDAIRALPMNSARILYATNSPATTYTDSYEKSESDLYKAMKNTRSLGTEDSYKGDGKVTFRELICVAEN